MNLLISLVLNAVALLATAYIVPGFHVADFTSALLAAIVVGVVNILLRPVLSYLAAPVTLLTFGLFSFVVNAAILWVASLFVPGFTLDGAVPAILGAVVLAVVSTILDSLVKEVGKVGKKK